MSLSDKAEEFYARPTNVNTRRCEGVFAAIAGVGGRLSSIEALFFPGRRGMGEADDRSISELLVRTSWFLSSWLAMLERRRPASSMFCEENGTLVLVRRLLRSAFDQRKCDSLHARAWCALDRTTGRKVPVQPPLRIPELLDQHRLHARLVDVLEERAPQSARIGEKVDHRKVVHDHDEARLAAKILEQLRARRDVRRFYRRGRHRFLRNGERRAGESEDGRGDQSSCA